MDTVLITTINEALLWSVMAIGVFIMYKILDIPDLSAEGVFPLGAAIYASQVVAGASPVVATTLAVVGGALAGLVAGLIHTKLKIPALLTGILVMTGLYTINIKVMGSGNISLLGKENLMDMINFLPEDFATMLLGAIIVLIVIILLYLFYRTQIGLAFIATGNNPVMAQANGINIDLMKIVGYMLANALIALSGSLIAQNNGYSDISMGVGIIVIGLAAVIVATVIFKNVPFLPRLFTVVLGAFIYRAIISIVLLFNIDPMYLKLVSAITLTLLLTLSNMEIFKKKRKG
ncbi:MAG: ABC transporter permease [Alphaproteobacteria bacterium]